MNYKDVVTLYFERSNEMQTLWSFYLSVCGIAALLVGIMRPSRRRFIVAAVLAFAFAVIAAVNLTAVMDISHERLACLHLLRSGTLPGTPPPEVQVQIEAGIQPPSIPSVLAVHIGGDLFTLATVLYLAISRRDSY